jgi:hypothetical protein
LHLTEPSMNRLNQTEPATFSIFCVELSLGILFFSISLRNSTFQQRHCVLTENQEFCGARCLNCILLLKTTLVRKRLHILSKLFKTFLYIELLKHNAVLVGNKLLINIFKLELYFILNPYI